MQQTPRLHVAIWKLEYSLSSNSNNHTAHGGYRLNVPRHIRFTYTLHSWRRRWRRIEAQRHPLRNLVSSPNITSKLGPGNYHPAHRCQRVIHRRLGLRHRWLLLLFLLFLLDHKTHQTGCITTERTAKRLRHPLNRGPIMQHRSPRPCLGYHKVTIRHPEGGNNT